MNKPESSPPRLVQGEVGPGLLRLTTPVILGISANIVAGLAETAFLSKLGTEVITAYSFTFPISAALMSLSLGISIGVSSVLARTAGGGDKQKVKRIASDGILLIGLIMILISLIGYLSITPLFALLGADDSTIPLIKQYMEIYYLSVFFLAVPAVGANALRALGDATISGTIMVSGALLHIAISPFLIFGLAGFPELGLTGAAWANLLARLITFTATILILHYREQLLSYRNLSLTKLLGSWKEILAVGIPATATNMIGPLSTAIIVSFLAEFSQETVAGFGIASRIEGLFAIPLFALSASIGPFVGQNVGANRHDRADEAMKLSFKFAFYWGIVIAIILAVSGKQLLNLFDTNPEVINSASTYLLIVPISYGAWGALMMSSAIFNSLGRPLYSTAMSVARLIIVYVPLAYIGKLLLGLPGIFLAAAISNTLLGLVGYLWNRSLYSKNTMDALG